MKTMAWIILVTEALWLTVLTETWVLVLLMVEAAIISILVLRHKDAKA